MFDKLSERIKNIAKNLSGKGRLSASQVKESMRDIRKALLEADVNLEVASDFVTEVENEV